MRVLWLSMTSGLLGKEGTGNYNGGGWISSLQHLVQESATDIDLALAFLSEDKKKKIITKNATYYPVYSIPKSFIEKIREYYIGYKNVEKKIYIKEIQCVIKDFRPDVIHMFGMESVFNDVLGCDDIRIPIVVHLQGLLMPCDNAFWPVGFNKNSFRWPPDKRENIFNNGYLLAKTVLNLRAQHERNLFKKVRYVMGRTEWDMRLSKMFAPQRVYYHVDEVLRPEFYGATGTWQVCGRTKHVIVSTISDTVYKGLDLILKTAHELTLAGVDFEWEVIGIEKGHRIIKFFERAVKISSNDVNIKYVGVCDILKMIPILQSANVYVHPSYIDNSPNSLCEAQMIGLPTIGTYVGGITSLIENEKTGILVPSNDPFMLAAKIKQLLEEREYANKIAKNGCAAARQRHDKRQIINDLISSYGKIIG